VRVSENLEVKQRIVFTELAAGTPMPDAIPATNTSSISITKISAPAVLQGESPTVGLSEKSAAHVGTL